MPESKYKAQRKALLYKPQNGYAVISEEDKNAMGAYARRYMDFLDAAKTEREAVQEAVRLAEAQGFRPYSPDLALTPGTKVYQTVCGKAINLAIIGKKPLSEGTRISAAHIDNPRLDLKPNPLYEEDQMAFFKTHYYGGIKKYQWTTVPMALHGVVVKQDGTVVDISLGEKDDDPVFIVTDLLIHLAGAQMEKKAAKVIEGEKLDILVGSMPLKDEEKDAVKTGVLAILKENYGMEEDDFMSAELEVVPAGRAREMGFDRSMIMSYGQDDRVCAYTSLAAMLEAKDVDKTACCLLVDKEEIGSVGATGMQSHFFENVVAELLNLQGDYSDLKLRRCMAASRMLSSDVNAAYDPLFADAFEKRSASFMGRGVVFSKFTGSRGKSGSNDANAEYLAALRRIMDDNGVNYQMAELGKVDIGGGGTIAYILSLYGMEVIDSGVAVLNMHAPWEVTSKADVYEAYKCYKAFLKDA